jgi:hypothetical protein
MIQGPDWHPGFFYLLTLGDISIRARLSIVPAMAMFHNSIRPIINSVLTQIARHLVVQPPAPTELLAFF